MEKILIVEPDNLLCQEIVKQTRLLGYSKVFYAFSGEEALEITQKEQPHLIVLNMSLPDYFGLEFPEIITSKSIIYGKPLFILLWDSFFVLESASVLEKKYRVMHLIKKPYEPAQLMEPIKNILSTEIVAAPSSSFSQDIPVEYIQVFIESAENFFQTMTSIRPKVGQFFFKNDPFSQSDVSSRMEIKGVMEGTICLSFDQSIATYVVSDMLQEELNEFNEDVKDGIGEVVNIITGNTKSFFQKKNIPFHIGLPKIFTGKHYTHPLSPRVPCIVIPFITPRGTLFVEICVQINENAKMEDIKPVPSIKEQKSSQEIVVDQPDINKIQAEIALQAAALPQQEQQLEQEKPAVSQADIDKIQAEMIEQAAKAPQQEQPIEQEKPAVSQADIDKIQAEIMAQAELQRKEDKDDPSLIAAQPEIEDIQKDIAASSPSEPQNEPLKQNKRPPVTLEDLQQIQAQMAAQNAAAPKKEKLQTEQKESSAPTLQDDGKPKIILTSASILKRNIEPKKETKSMPKMMSPSQPAFKIEPKKPSTDYKFKPSEPDVLPSNLRPEASDDEQNEDREP